MYKLSFSGSYYTSTVEHSAEAYTFVLSICPLNNELKQSTSQTNPIVRRMSQMVSHTKPQVAAPTSQSTHVMVSPQASDSITPMEVDLQKSRPKTWKCYNCQKIGHLTNNCTEPRKQHTQNNFLEKDISDIIVKAIATTLDDWEKQKEVKADVKADF